MTTAERPIVPPFYFAPWLLLAASVLFILACASALGGCAHTQGGQPVSPLVVTGDVAAQCALPDLVKDAGSFLLDVKAILTNGQPHWQAELDQLKKQWPQAILCAVATVVADLGVLRGVTTGDEAAQLTAAKERGEIYLRKNGVDPAKVRSLAVGGK